MRQSETYHHMPTPFTTLAFLFCLGSLLTSPLFSQSKEKGHTSASNIPANTDYVAGNVILRFDPQLRPLLSPHDLADPDWKRIENQLPQAQLEAVFPAAEPVSDQALPSNIRVPDPSLIYYLHFDTAFPVSAALQLIAQYPYITYVEPWYIHHLFYQPNDPLIDTTGGLDGPYFMNLIKAREAWDSVRNDASILIGVVDNGTFNAHPDMIANLHANTADPIDGIDNDQDGYIDNYNGWDFGGDLFVGPPDNDPSVGNVHGLWVAGTIAATADNGLGGAGVCFNCQYIPIKVAPNDDLGSIFYGYQGIMYAVEQGAQVVNCSWGGINDSEFGRDVVNYASYVKGVAVVAACGNNSSDFRYYPAGYEPVISVANTHRNDTLFDNSTYHRSVDMTAPGNRIISPAQTNAYHYWQGTSAAAPLVAGAIGLVKSYFPHYTGFQAAQRVRVTADDRIYDINSLPIYQDRLGTGRLDMHQAIVAEPKPSIRNMSFQAKRQDGSAYPQPGDTVSLDMTWINYLDFSSQVSINISVEDFGASVVSWLDQTESYSAWSPLELKGREAAFKMVVSANAPLDFPIIFKLTYTDTASGYEDIEFIEYLLNPSFIDITQNQLYTSVSSRGGWGFNDFETQNQGLGIRYQQQSNVLFEGGFLVANSPLRVSDNIRKETGRDLNFQPLQLIRPFPATITDGFEAVGLFTDANTSMPVNLNIRERVLASNQSTDDDYVILAYTLTNLDNSINSNVFAGLYADWDINPTYNAVNDRFETRNVTLLDQANRMVYAYDLTDPTPVYYGISLLSDQNLHAFAPLDYPGFAYSNANKYLALSHDISFGYTSAGFPTGADIAHFISGGPMNLPGQGKTDIAFAILAGNSLSDLMAHRTAALARYKCYISGEGPITPFSISDTLIPIGNSVSLADLNAKATSWSWDFGDGTTAQGANATHTYAQKGVYTITLRVADSLCQAIHRQEVLVRQPLSIPAAQEPRIKLFPNPSSDLLTVTGKDLPLGPMEYTLTNILGQPVLRMPITLKQPETVWQIDVHTLPPSLYTLSLTDPATGYTWFQQSFMVKR